MGVARQKWQSAKGRLRSKDLDTILRPKEKFGSHLDTAEGLIADIETKLKSLLSDAAKFDATATAVAAAARSYSAALTQSALRQRTGGEGVTPTDAQDLIDALKEALKQAKRIHKAKLGNFDNIHDASARIQRLVRSDMFR